MKNRVLTIVLSVCLILGNNAVVFAENTDTNYSEGMEESVLIDEAESLLDSSDVPGEEESAESDELLDKAAQSEKNELEILDDTSVLETEEEDLSEIEEKRKVEEDDLVDIIAETDDVSDPCDDEYDDLGSMQGSLNIVVEKKDVNSIESIDITESIQDRSAALAEEESVIDSGLCGDDLTWTLNDVGVLTIEGIGDMYSYSDKGGPWLQNHQNDIEEVVVKEGVTSLGDSCFIYLYQLFSAKLPNTLTTINYGAFSYCNSLESIIIPDSVSYIGEKAFYNCNHLAGIAVPRSVTVINEGTFQYCENLDSISLPDTIIEIGAYAFKGDRYLNPITIPENCTTIKKSAFLGCSSVTSFTLPASVQIIEDEALSGGFALENIFVDYDNPYFKSVDGVLYSKDGKKLISYPFAKTGSTVSFTVPDGVTEIDDNAFHIGVIYCRENSGSWKNCCFDTLTIPDSITIINSLTLNNIQVNNLFLPRTIERINKESFTGGRIDNLYINRGIAPSAPASAISHDIIKTLHVPEGAQGYDTSPWTRMTVVYDLPPVPIDDIVLEKEEYSICPGMDFTIGLTFIPFDATETISWSTNSNIVTVDQNGNVIAKTVGTATITISAGGVSKTVTVEVHEHRWNEEFTIDKAASYTEEGQQSIHCSVCDAIDESTITPIPRINHAFIIKIGNYALSTETSDDQYTPASNYCYTGLAAKQYTSDSDLSNDILWILEEVEGGYYIRSFEGAYLNATYTNGSNGGYLSDLKLDNTPDVWVLDSGATFETWEKDGSFLRSANNDSRYLAMTTGTAGSQFFTVRSQGSTEKTTVEEVGSSAVTGITISPATTTIETRKTVQLSANVSTSGVTSRRVVWTSSDASVATVDSNGKVKGVAEGTTTITATTVNGGKSASAQVTVTPSTSVEQNYVIVVDNYALSIEQHPNTVNLSGSNAYTGLLGVAYSEGIVADDSIRWIIEETNGGYYIMSLDGLYLNATYSSGGNLKLDDTPDVWILDDGYSFINGKVEGSKLRSTNADGRCFRYEESANLFTVRSSGNKVMIEEVGEPVAVTGITVSPATVNVEARKAVQLTTVFTPDNATYRRVTWTSSDTSVATVNSSGRVKGVAEGTAIITATTVKDGKTASALVTVTPSTSTEPNYVIVTNGYALSMDRSPNVATGSSSYSYTGLAGVAYSEVADVDDSILWILEETTGGYHIMSLDGLYLNATYISGAGGDLKLDETPDVWALDSGYSFTEGIIDGSKLKSTNASGASSGNKYITYESSANLFTVRSSGNNVTIELVRNPVPATGITLDQSATTIKARRTIQLTATVEPSNATYKKIKWSSSDPAVATVDANGKVQGVAEGTATITAMLAKSGQSAACEIVVLENTSIMEGTCGKDLEWELTQEGTLVITGSGKMTSCPWTDSIDQILSVDLPEGLTNIYDYAFKDSWITGVLDIPEGVVSIGTQAFSNCEFITGINLPSTIKDIKSQAFKNCIGVREPIIIDNANAIIEDEAFCNCSRIPSISINAQTVGSSAFSGCKKISSIMLSDNIESIDQYAFDNCTLINELTYSNNTVFSYADFTKNNVLESIIITGNGSIKGASDEYSPLAIFKDSIKLIVCDGDMETVGDNAFVGCNQVEKIVLSDTIKSIGSNAFKDCSLLQDVNIPSNLSALGSCAFYGCSSLGNTLSLPDSLKEIGSSAFYRCIGIVDIQLPRSIAKIDANSFQGCAGLSTVFFPESILKIDDSAFAECTNLTRAVFYGEPPIVFGANVFSDCAEEFSILYPSTATGWDTPVWENYPAFPSNGIDPSGHVWKEEYDIDNPATCTEEGLESIHCLVCGTIKEGSSRIIPAMGHQWNSDYTIDTAATCTHEGIESIHCSVCNIIKEGSEKSISKTAHNYGDWTVTEAATCTAEGSKEKVCTYCGEKVTETILATGHTTVKIPAVAATCTETGLTEGSKCSVCGTILQEQEIVPALGHSLKETPAIPATYTSTGNIEYWTCDTCKKCFSDENGTTEISLDDTIVPKLEKKDQSITAKAEKTSVAVGKTTTITTTGAKGTVSYKSSDKTIATISSAGKITAKKVGTVKITVTAAATDSYKDATKTLTIKVVPAATSSISATNLATGMKVSWKKVTGATGYYVYRKAGSCSYSQVKKITSGSTVTCTDTKANTNGTKYTYKIVAYAGTGKSTLSKTLVTYRLSRPTISSLTSSAATKLTAKWGKNAKGTGYEIQCSLKSGFSTIAKEAPVTSKTTVSKTLTGLTSGKTYYVRIRTYKTVSGETYYSAWSEPKSVKVK